MNIAKNLKKREVIDNGIIPQRLNTQLPIYNNSFMLLHKAIVGIII